MRVLYEKGVATHFGPESCAGVREDVGEALTGERASRVLSREILPEFGVPPQSSYARGNTGPTAIREVGLGPARSETPRAHGSFSHGNREALRLATRTSSPPATSSPTVSTVATPRLGRRPWGQGRADPRSDVRTGSQVARARYTGAPCDPQGGHERRAVT